MITCRKLGITLGCPRSNYGASFIINSPPWDAFQGKHILSNAHSERRLDFIELLQRWQSVYISVNKANLASHFTIFNPRTAAESHVNTPSIVMM